MANQALFYEHAVPLTRERYRDWSIETDADYAFARNALCVPLTTVEFSKAAAELPIVFLDHEGSMRPVALLGLEDAQNLHVSESGAWVGRYIPAYVRRYPFIFATHDDGKTFTLCVDERFPGLNQEGKGERLFSDEGGNSPYLEQVLTFLKEYEVQYRITGEFCRQVTELEVLEPMQASVSLASGATMGVGGFHLVKRERVSDLDGEVLSRLARRSVLELLYLHLFSLENFSRLVARLTGSPDEEQAF